MVKYFVNIIVIIVTSYVYFIVFRFLPDFITNSKGLYDIGSLPLMMMNILFPIIVYKKWYKKLIFAVLSALIAPLVFFLIFAFAYALSMRYY
jgi:hypothetical protein